MTKLIFLPLVVLSLAAFPAIAIADHSEGTGPSSQDKADGSAKFSLVDAHVVVNATSGPAGQDPDGKFGLDQMGVIDFFADVTCLNVVGNKAAIGGVVTKTKTGFPPPGEGILQLVIDNGEPGADSPPPDMSQTFFTGAPPAVCPDPNTIVVGFNVDQGNYVVHDAP
jgi:hypothetical protein